MKHKNKVTIYQWHKKQTDYKCAMTLRSGETSDGTKFAEIQNSNCYTFDGVYVYDDEVRIYVSRIRKVNNV